MPNFRISGVWKDANDVITHYAIHTVGETSTSRAKKVSKTDAVKLLENTLNKAVTWLWDYSQCKWRIGEDVVVVSGDNGKFLRTNPDKTERNNLAHLIDYDWIAP